VDALAKLDSEKRALVLVSVLRAGVDAPGLLERGPGGPDCVGAARALLALPARVRAERLAALAWRLFAPLPPGLSEVHPSWIEAATAGEPAYLVAAARHGGPPGLTIYLRRRILGQLVAMPQGPPRARALLDLDDLPRLSFAALERLVETLGRRRVVAAFGVAGPPAIAQLAARLGEPWGSELVIEARRLHRHDREEGQRALLQMAELARRAQHGRTLVLRAGAGRLAPALFEWGGDLLGQVAQRLPFLTGRMLLEEAAGAPPTSHERLVADLRTIM